MIDPQDVGFGHVYLVFFQAILITTVAIYSRILRTERGE